MRIEPGLTYEPGLSSGSGESALVYDRLTPAQGAHRWVVMLHGGGVTGACWLSTVDGRPGWAQRLAGRGYGVLVPNWPTVVGSRGRSDTLTGARLREAVRGLIEEVGAPTILIAHSMSGPVGFSLLEMSSSSVAALVAIAPGPPGNIQKLPLIIAETEEYIQIQTAASSRRIPKSGEWLPSRDFILDKFVGSGTRFPPECIPSFEASIAPIPASMVLERQNVGGSQLRVANPEALRDRPILIVTGDSDKDHTHAADGEISEWLSTCGADVTYDFLSEPGFEGNAHMLMGESNSDEIADRICIWLASKGLGPGSYP